MFENNRIYNRDDSAVTGVSFIAIGAAGRLGKIGLNKDVSSFVLGYGISCIISIMINYISAMALSDECRTQN